MAYHMNVGNYLNNLTNVSGQEMPSRETNGSSVVKNAVEQIKNMLAGDIFTGEVTDVNGTAVSIKMGNGQVLNASLLLENQQATFSKGEMVTFLVNDKNDNKISLKPLDSGAQEIVLANKALEASNLAMNKENLAMIKGLLDLNMPIDKNTLNDVSRLLAKFPDASMDTVLRLYKLEMPVTQDNITMFDAYKNYEHDMTGTIKFLAQDFNGLVNQMVQEGNSTGVAELARDFLELFSKETIQTENTTFAESPAIKDNVRKEKNPETTNQLPIRSDGMKNPEKMEEVLKKPAEEILELVKKQGKTEQEKTDFFKTLFRNHEMPKETLSRLAQSEEFKSLFEGLLKEKLFLKPEDVAQKKDVKEFYENLLKTVHEGEELLQKAGAQNSDMAKGLHSVKTNLEFMNDLNHQMAFLQIPIKFQEGEAKGDLYVYTNKKALAGKNDDLTALLHLDMEHLGPMDVYVKMTAGNHVSTNFCLESEAMLDFIYEHIDILTKRLNQKGYDFTPTMTVREEGTSNQVDFEKDFLDVSSPVIPVSRYLFDMKA